MNKLYLKIIVIAILICFNYSCEALCNDEDSPRVQKESAVHKKPDSLQVSSLD